MKSTKVYAIANVARLLLILKVISAHQYAEIINGLTNIHLREIMHGEFNIEK